MKIRKAKESVVELPYYIIVFSHRLINRALLLAYPMEFGSKLMTQNLLKRTIFILRLNRQDRQK